MTELKNVNDGTGFGLLDEYNNLELIVNQGNATPEQIKRFNALKKEKQEHQNRENWRRPYSENCEAYISTGWNKICEANSNVGWNRIRDPWKQR